MFSPTRDDDCYGVQPLLSCYQLRKLNVFGCILFTSPLCFLRLGTMIVTVFNLYYHATSFASVALLDFIYPILNCHVLPGNPPTLLILFPFPVPAYIRRRDIIRLSLIPSNVPAVFRSSGCAHNVWRHSRFYADRPESQQERPHLFPD